MNVELLKEILAALYWIVAFLGFVYLLVIYPFHVLFFLFILWILN